jgi:hypothetical protein
MSGSNFNLGITTVTCTATDTSAHTAMCSFTVAVRRPNTAILDLRNRVRALAPPNVGAPLTTQQANQLIGQLELAYTHLGQGQTAACCTDLANFVNQVNLLTPPLSAAQSLDLRSYANKIRNALSCAGGPFTPAKKLGVFYAGRGEFYLKQRLMTGLPELMERYGQTGDLPVAGDWEGDGIDSLGVFRQGVFYLRPARLAEPKAGPHAEEIVVEFGEAGDLPVVGDWDGDGVDTIGVYRAGEFLLRNSNRAGLPDIVVQFGAEGELPVAGDWDGDGTVTIGSYNLKTGVFKLSNALKGGLVEVEVQWGGPGYLPVVGDWDGDGVTTIGLYGVNGEFLLRNTNTAGPADLVLTLGLRGGLPIAGYWGEP